MRQLDLYIAHLNTLTHCTPKTPEPTLVRSCGLGMAGRFYGRKISSVGINQSLGCLPVSDYCHKPS